ncbi:MAG: DUF4493 domain-containing protein [Bacteroidales bacterium]|jgi:chitodextrinase|nr:DUF4493 domain-containing protein [Bacteroidales bacterium]MCI2122526.1 DUF4493 domain-containing protein [Bacteroidales bacterium]MCI2145283.1 DUF4493 domain-containing protein [Bacteroidales bacterium]
MNEKVKGGLISVLLSGTLAAALTGCQGSLFRRDGYISLRFDRESVSGVITKGAVYVPDTSAFILCIRNVSGTAIYEGAYSERPSTLSVPAGTYVVKVVSEAFEVPAFDKPVFGDEQTIVVSAGEHVSVNLRCSRTNCGINLLFTERFRTKFSDHIMTLDSGDGSLEYGLYEARTAYFNAGEVTFTAESGTTSIDVFKRTLETGRILTVKLDASTAETAGTPQFKIYVDTSAVYVSESVLYDENASGNDGVSKETAFTVAEAGIHIGEKVWVTGYIVGGDCSSSGTVTFSGPFEQSAHMAIADSPSENVSSNCMCIQLTAGTEARTALNLVDNPGNIGKRVWLHGTVDASYFKLIGLKGTTDYAME